MSWFPKHKVVVPTDFSDQSYKALDTALELVESPSNVHLIHVLPELSATEPGVIWDTLDDESRTRHATEAIRERLSEAKYNGVQIDVAVGDPGHEIVELAEKEGAELIVLPSHGRRGLKRMLIGSVAERVIRLAHCPVLVLRGLSRQA